MIAAVLRRNRQFMRLALAVTAGVTLVPTLLFPLPPLLDFPNHLARLWLIMGGIHLSPLDRIYAEDWSGIATNIGIDLAAKAFTGVVPPLLLGRILLALAVLLPAVGGVMLSRALFGRWHPWQVLFFFFWSCQTLLAGFLNFHIGLGLALLAAAIDGHLKRWRHAVRLTVAFVLIVVHPFALLFYCALLAGLGFGAAPFRNADSWRRTLKTAEAAICLVPVMVFFVLTRAVPGTGGNALSDIIYPNIGGTAVALLSPFVSYDLFFVDALFLAGVVSIIVIWAMNNRFRIHTGLLTVAIALTLVSPLLPNIFSGTGWVDRRLPIMAVLAGLAAVLPQLRKARHGLALSVGLSCFVAARTLWIGWNWAAGVPMIDAMQAVLAKVPAGARILPMQHKYWPPNQFPRGHILGVDIETYNHYAALAVIWRHAYIPMLFSQPGKQPVHILPPYDRVALPGGGMLPSVHALANDAAIPPGQENVRYWRTDFDYVLVLNANRPDKLGPLAPLPELQLVKDAGFARLYRIRQP